MFTARHRLVGAAALLITAAACSNTGSSTGPNTISNPSAATASLNGVDSTFSTPAFQSFLTVTALLTSSGPTAPYGHVADLLKATAPRTPRPLSGPAMGAALRVLAHDMAGVESIIPDSLLGTTYVWDSTDGGYVPDPDSTGAPSNGVRFELYEVDSTGNIGYPLTQVGHLDLKDLSTAGTQSLEVIVASNTFTYVDYTVSGTGTISAFNLSAIGYIRSTVRTLNFNIAYALAQGSYSISETFTDATDQLSLTFTFGITQTSDTSAAVTLAFTYTVGAQSIAINGGGTLNAVTESLQGTVTVNGGTFAVITAVGLRGSTPTVTDGQGHPLTVANAVLLLRMFDIVGHALGWLNDFVGLFVGATGVGVILSL